MCVASFAFKISPCLPLYERFIQSKLCLSWELRRLIQREKAEESNMVLGPGAIGLPGNDKCALANMDAKKG